MENDITTTIRYRDKHCVKNLQRISAGFFLLVYFSLAGCIGGGKLILLQDGKSNYKIVVPNHATDIERQAALTLQKYFASSTGFTLPIEEGGGKNQCESIWIGQTEHLGQCPARIPWKKLAEDGFTIKTNDSNLLIAGGTEKGALYGVCTFLEDYLDCRKYSAKFQVIPKKSTLILEKIDITQVSVFTFREIHYRDAFDPSYRIWHKLDAHEDDWGLFVHTFQRLVPPQKYFADHPEFFSLLPSGRVPDAQLCLTNPEVFQIVVQALRDLMKEKPQVRYWSVSQNDTFSPCECEQCRKISEAEGSPSGSLLQFVNKVAAEFPDKTISTLAYQYSRSAPKTIKPAKNVNIMLCSIECNRSKPLAADPSSASFVKDMKDWSKLTKNIFLWDYVVQFRNLISPFPNLRVLQPNIQFFARNGIKEMFQQGAGGGGGEFAELRSYIIAKLLWNPNVDINAVMDDFLRGYYGKAAPFVRQYIDEMHNALEKSGEDLLIYGYPMPSENGYLSAAQMDKYHAIFDQAEKTVQEDSVYLHHVQAARLPLWYATLEQAKICGTGERGFFFKNQQGTWEVKSRYLEILVRFVKGCSMADMKLVEENGYTPENYYQSMKRFLTVSMQNHLALFQAVTLTIPASKKYHNGDAGALTNGLKGLNDYNMNWLGFEGADMEAVIDLGKIQPVQKISADFLQATIAWIWLPVSVEFDISLDGNKFDIVAILKNRSPERKEGSFIQNYTANFKKQNARYIRVRVTGLKTCPGWHKGAGGLAWLFTDEIIVN